LLECAICFLQHRLWIVPIDPFHDDLRSRVASTASSLIPACPMEVDAAGEQKASRRHPEQHQADPRDAGGHSIKSRG
jgi:hypothetical protein